MDGFKDLQGSMEEFDFSSLFRVDEKEAEEEGTVGPVRKTRDIIHKDIGKSDGMGKMLSILYRIAGHENPGGTRALAEYLILLSHGKRNMRKDAVSLSNLSERERASYTRIIARPEAVQPVRIVFWGLLTTRISRSV